MKYLGISTDDAAGLEVMGFAAQIGHQAAGFLYEQDSGGDVPGRKAELPETIQTSRGDIGEVERGGARAAHARNPAHHGAKHPQVLIHALQIPVGKSGADQGVPEVRALGHANAPVIEKCAAAAAGVEKLVLGHVVDDTVREGLPVHQGDRYRVLRKTMDEIGGAVQRIDDPGVLGRAPGARGSAGLLC